MGLFDFLKKNKTDDVTAPVEEVSPEATLEPVVEEMAAPEVAPVMEDTPVEEPVVEEPVAM